MRTDHCQRLFAMSMSFALLSNLTTGCTAMAQSRGSSPSNSINSANNTETLAEPPATSNTGDSLATVPVIRYDRYTLVELIAEPAQRDLMQQIVEITIPPTLDATVGDAMHYVLLRSGYRLCSRVEASALYTLPLPAAHLH